jgi:hypothetical protein
MRKKDGREVRDKEIRVENHHIIQFFLVEM